MASPPQRNELENERAARDSSSVGGDGRQPERPNDVDTSPLFLWAAVLVGLVVTALVAARFLGKL